MNFIMISEAELRWLLSVLRVVYSNEESIAMCVLVVETMAHGLRNLCMPTKYDICFLELCG